MRFGLAVFYFCFGGFLFVVLRSQLGRDPTGLQQDLCDSTGYVQVWGVGQPMGVELAFVDVVGPVRPSLPLATCSMPASKQTMPAQMSVT